MLRMLRCIAIAYPWISHLEHKLHFIQQPIELQRCKVTERLQRVAGIYTQQECTCLLERYSVGISTSSAGASGGFGRGSSVTNPSTSITAAMSSGTSNLPKSSTLIPGLSWQIEQ